MASTLAGGDADAITVAAVGAAPELDETARARELAAVQRALFGVADVEADDVRVGSTLGRYVVLESIGRGAMGKVARAYDPKLRREVALKRVVAHRLTDDGSARLLREAQAMAQLSHPNVVAVHDVESIGGEVVLVMQYVPGRTLQQWLGDQQRSWQEILAAFRDAGAGLHAAHRVGIVHRDFKPSNVLVAVDGAVKVTDFGLAKATGETDSPSGHDSRGDDFVDDAASQLTRAGTVLGTPRYMAPEQHAGITDARVDQYAFCVALWEALCAQPPFGGRTLEELARSKRAGPPAWTGPRLPGHMVTALRTGLATDPARRFADMGALLHALRPRSRSRPVGLAVATVLVVSSIVAVSMMASTRRCTGARQKLAAVWDDDRAQTIAAAFTRAQVQYADETAARVRNVLDDWADAWVRAHDDACEATSVRGEQSTEILDLRMACLQRSQRELAVIVRTLEAADVQVVDRVDDVLSGLPRVERCSQVEGLRAAIAPPDDPQSALAVEGVRLDLSECAALRRAGKLEPALAILDGLAPVVTTLGYAPLAAEAALERGRVLESLARYAEAEAALRLALGTALAQGAWALAAAAAGELAHNVGASQRRGAEGRALADLAVGLAEGARSDADLLAAVLMNAAAVAEADGDFARAETVARRAWDLRRAARGPDDPQTAASAVTLGLILDRLGRLAEADELVERALAVRRRALGSGHPAVAATTNVLGTIRISRGRFDEAENLYRDAIEQWSRVYGPEHILVAHATANLGLVLHHQGRLVEAEVHHRRALARREAVLGADHLTTLASLNNLGMTLVSLERHDEALTVLERVLHGREQALGGDHLETASARNNLAMVLLDRGDAVTAEATWRSALATWEQHLGPDHHHVGAATYNIGLALAAQGRALEAEAAYREALGIWERSLPTEHVNLGQARSTLGEALIDRGQLDEARALLERAWKARPAGGGNARVRAEIAFGLARSVHPIDRERAAALLEDARNELADLEEADPLRDRIDGWARRRR